ncbi:MAG: hypothetical protein AAF721_24420 [Myxococcota bacterium]
MVQEWSGVIEGEIVGDAVQFDMAFSNIDANAMDGLTGPTEVSIEVSVQ